MKRKLLQTALLLLLTMCTLAVPVGAAGVRITGDAVYGGVLRMEGLAVQTGWVCTWEYGGEEDWTPIVYANQRAELELTHEFCNTYDMVGRMIRVTMTEASSGQTYQAQTGPVEKGPQEPPEHLRAAAPSGSGALDGTIYNLNPELIYAYSADGGRTWKSVETGAKAIEGLASGTYLVRSEENQWGLRSEPTAVTVPGNDEEIVEEWFQSEAFLTELLGDNADAAQITAPLTRRTTVGNDVCVKYGGTQIVWSAEPEGYLDVSDGTVTRPSDGAPKQVTLTAAITLGGDMTLTRAIELTIQPLYQLGGAVRLIRTSAGGRQYRDGWQNAEVGDTLSLDFSGVTPAGVSEADIKVQWIYLQSTRERSIAGATNGAYTVASEQSGKRVGVKLTGDGGLYDDSVAVKAYIPGVVVATGQTSDELEPEEALPEERFTSELVFGAPVSAARAGKLTYRVYQLAADGSISAEAGAGTLTQTNLPLSLCAGDYRVELHGAGYLPYVVRLQNVSAESKPPAKLTAAALVPGKLYLDGVQDYAVTTADFQQMLEVYDAPAGLDDAHRAADFNNSGDVDFFDLAALMENIGKTGQGQPRDGDYTPSDLNVDCRLEK